jgi:hypothetical protein
MKFLNEKIVIKSDVSNFCEMSNSSSSLLNESCVEVIKIEEKKEKKRSSFCFESFVIDVLFDYRQNCKEENFRKKKKNVF